MSKIKDIIISMPITGCCEINVDVCISKWSPLFEISQWKDEYRLIKYKRKNTALTDIKCTIEANIAKQIIDRLDLKSYSGMFASATTWK